MVDYLPEVFKAAGLAVVGPQMAARQLMRQIETEPPEGLTAIKPYVAEGHMMADEVVARWHQDRRSSAYLNLDSNDDSPGLPLDVALSPAGQPATIMVLREEAPDPGFQGAVYPAPRGAPAAGDHRVAGLTAPDAFAAEFLKPFRRCWLISVATARPTPDAARRRAALAGLWLRPRILLTQGCGRAAGPW
jgi:hypothetical protein